jgi:hypothetical protein
MSTARPHPAVPSEPYDYGWRYVPVEAPMGPRPSTRCR